MGTLMAMTWPHAIMFFAIIGFIAAWLVAVIPFIRIANEIDRLRQIAQLPMGVPPVSKGLPAAAIFTKGILPRVELERRVLVWAIIASLGFFLTLVILAGMYGPIPGPR